MTTVRAGEPYDGDPAFDALYGRFAPLLHRIAVKKFGIPAADAETLVYDIFATYLTHCDRVDPSAGYFIGSMCNVARSYLAGGAANREPYCGQVPCVATPTDEILLETGRERLITLLRRRLSSRWRSLKQTIALLRAEAKRRL